MSEGVRGFYLPVGRPIETLVIDDPSLRPDRLIFWTADVISDEGERSLHIAMTYRLSAGTLIIDHVAGSGGMDEEIGVQVNDWERRFFTNDDPTELFDGYTIRAWSAAIEELIARRLCDWQTGA